MLSTCSHLTVQVGLGVADRRPIRDANRVWHRWGFHGSKPPASPGFNGSNPPASPGVQGSSPSRSTRREAARKRAALRRHFREQKIRGDREHPEVGRILHCTRHRCNQHHGAFITPRLNFAVSHTTAPPDPRPRRWQDSTRPLPLGRSVNAPTRAATPAGCLRPARPRSDRRAT
jgi:hypothetical protein